MRRMTGLVLAGLAVGGLVFAMSGCSKKEGGSAKNASAVSLTLGSWRADDVAQWTALLAEYKKASGVDIRFQPVNPPDYNATLRTQLDGGAGPDLMFARSYATGEELFNIGYFGDCTDIPGVKTNFSASSLAPWQTEAGKMFAVPVAAVSHAVYYNKDIFTKYGLSVPATWEDFLAVCAALKEKGVTPLANGTKDEWDILETFFLGLLPDYIGGAAERVKYEAGEKKLNDASFVAAFQAMKDVSPYLPSGYEAVDYNSSQALFSTQQAAMDIDGSWTAQPFSELGFDWGVFAIPAPAGKKTAICFHPDMAITYNSKTAHPEEAKAFLAWLASTAGAAELAKALPVGFFPMVNAQITLADKHANEFLALNSGRETDARFVWPKFMSLYAPMNQAVIAVVKGQKTPQQAADEMEAAAAPLR